MVAWFYQSHPRANADPTRSSLCMALVCLWSARLTHSYFRRYENADRWSFAPLAPPFMALKSSLRPSCPPQGGVAVWCQRGLALHRHGHAIRAALGLGLLLRRLPLSARTAHGDHMAAVHSALRPSPLASGLGLDRTCGRCDRQVVDWRLRGAASFIVSQHAQ